MARYRIRSHHTEPARKLLSRIRVGEALLLLRIRVGGALLLLRIRVGGACGSIRIRVGGACGPGALKLTKTSRWKSGRRRYQGTFVVARRRFGETWASKHGVEPSCREGASQRSAA